MHDASTHGSPCMGAHERGATLLRKVTHACKSTRPSMRGRAPMRGRASMRRRHAPVTFTRSEAARLPLRIRSCSPSFTTDPRLTRHAACTRTPYPAWTRQYACCARFPRCPTWTWEATPAPWSRSTNIGYCWSCPR